MDSEMVKKMESVKGKLIGQPLSTVARGSQELDDSMPCEDSDSPGEMCRQSASAMLKRMLSQKSERVAALAQLAQLFDAGHIKDGSPLEALIWEWLGRERRY